MLHLLCLPPHCYVSMMNLHMLMPFNIAKLLGLFNTCLLLVLTSLLQSINYPILCTNLLKIIGLAPKEFSITLNTLFIMFYFLKVASLFIYMLFFFMLIRLVTLMIGHQQMLILFILVATQYLGALKCNIQLLDHQQSSCFHRC